MTKMLSFLSPSCANPTPAESLVYGYTLPHSEQGTTMIQKMDITMITVMIMMTMDDDMTNEMKMRLMKIN